MHYVVPSMSGYGCIFDTNTKAPVAERVSNINAFKQADAEINSGHVCCHLKGKITSLMSRLKLTNGRVYEYYGTPLHTGYIQTRSAGNFQCVQSSKYTRGTLWSPLENALEYTWSASGSLTVSTAPSQFGIWYEIGVYHLAKVSDHQWQISFGNTSGVAPYDQPIDPSSIEVPLRYQYVGDLSLVYDVDTSVGDPSDTVLANEAYSIYEDYLERGPQGNVSYSYLCADAADKIIYNHSNTLMNTMDILRFKGDVSKMYDSYLEFATQWKGQKPLKKAKQAASAYLGTLYGPRLSCKEMADIVTRETESVTHGSTTATRACEFRRYHLKASGEARVSFQYRYGVYQSVQETLGSWGISPITMTDIWDAVPYSFVVDWFVDVSDYLDRSRLKGFMEEIPVSEIWYSEKTRLAGTVYNDNWTSIADLRLYYRTERSALGTNLHGYVSPSGDPAWRGKGLQLGSLLIQQL